MKRRAPKPWGRSPSLERSGAGPLPAYRSSLGRGADALFLAALVALPLAGIGLVTLLTGRDPGAGFQPSYLLMAAAVILAAAAVGPRRLLAGWSNAGGWPWLAAVGALSLSAAGLVLAPSLATPQEAWLRYAKQTVQWGVTAVFALHTAWWLQRDDRRWRAAVGALSVGLVLQLLYAAWQAWGFYHPGAAFARTEAVVTSNASILSGSQELYLGRGFVGIPRLRGTICEPLYLGNYLLAVLPWLWAAGRPGRAGKALVGAGLALLLLTWSRGAWFAAVLSAVCALVAGARAEVLPPRRRRLRHALIAAAVVAVAVAVTGGEGPSLILRRLRQTFSTEDWSNLTRWYSMQAAWRCFLTAPWTGVGWGQYGFHFPLLVDPMGLQSQFSWPVANNVVLKILGETGAPGLAAFLAGVVALARRTWRALTAAATPVASERLRVVAAAAAVVGVWSQLLTFSQDNLPHIWVALGMLMAATGRTSDGEGEAAP
jgi:O-antigen ligase